MPSPNEEPARAGATALERALEVLACPVCAEPLDAPQGGAVAGNALRCGRGHSFDIARQGYASLTSGGGPHFQGDTAAMVAARANYLATGHYRPIADAITTSAVGGASAVGGWCLELAGGTGYYTARVLDAAPTLSAITLDVSKHAARAAARTHPRLASVTGDARATLPVASGAIDLVLSVFGPRRGDEVARVLAPGGTAVVVTPRPAHLAELREQFSLLAIGADKEARLATAMAPLVHDGTTELDYVVELAPEDVLNVIMMGPNAFHRTRADLAELIDSSTGTLRTTVSVSVSRFRRPGERTP